MKKLALLATFAGALAACSTPPPVTTGPITTRTDGAEAAAAAISAYRQARGLPPVKVDYTLMRMAEHQARAVAQAGYLSHEVGGDFSSRLSSFGVKNRTAAENLSAGAKGPLNAVERWKASASHNENMLLPGATRIGFVEAEAPETRYKRYFVLEIGRAHV